MSAICGEISFSQKLSSRFDEFKRMSRKIKHRGNDYYGINVKNNIAFCQGVLDTDKLSYPSIPYTFEVNNNKYILCYDGMLFNSEEIKEKLAEKGYSVSTNSDFELIIKCYLAYKNEMLNFINGVFAFVIFDENKNEAFFARDRLGVRPFFYSNNNDNFIFGSEIKALLENKEVEAEIDINSVAELMLIGPGRTLGYGVFNGIEELKPGYCGTYSQSGLNIRQYWKIPVYEHKDSFEQTVEKVRYLVKDSIHRQIECNVPICTMLSGGLDSSIISSVAKEFLDSRGEKLETFTVNYTDNDKYFKSSKFQPNSDSQFVGIMNDCLGVKNNKIEISQKDLANALYSAVEARDLPGMADIDSSLLIFSQEISKHYKVCLSGECSDEIFGGYPWYRDKTLRERAGFPWAQSTEYRKSLINGELLAQIDAEKYVDAKYRQTVREAPKLGGFDKDEKIKEMMKLNLDWFMMTLVDRTDRMCAFNSFDVRVPYCDYRIVEYLYNVPWEFKDCKGYEKGLLREAFKDYLPEEILWRKKSPYPKTHNPEYLRIVRQELKNLVNNPNAPIFKIVNKSNLEKLLYMDVPQNFYGQLMTTPQTIAYFLQLNYWLEKYNVKIKL